VTGKWLVPADPGERVNQSPADTLCLQGIAEARRQAVESAEGEHQKDIARGA